MFRVHARSKIILALVLAFCCAIGLSETVSADQITQAKPKELVKSRVFKNISKASSKISGYATNISIRPGQPLVLRVEAPRSWSLEVYRQGNYSGSGLDGRLVTRVGPLTRVLQPDPLFLTDTRTVDASNWKNSITLSSKKWRPGLYVIKLIMGNYLGYIPFVVRTPNLSGKTVYVASFQTMAAYNSWGGYSAYKGRNGNELSSANRSTRITFSRPWGASALQHFLDNELGMSKLVDRFGKNVGWTTDYDVSTGSSYLAGARALVTSSHDEYWSLQNRISFTKAIAGGTNVIISGGNISYWRIRYDKERQSFAPAFYIYKFTPDPIAEQQPEIATTFWRAEPSPSPESLLTAGMYNHSANRCGSTRDFRARVVSNKWFGFSGLRLKPNQTVHGLANHEMDQILPNSKIPERTQVLLHANFECPDFSGDTVRLSYDMTYYTTQSHAAVFSAGTTAWGCSVSRFCVPKRKQSRDAGNFVRTVMKNLLTEFSRKDVGLRHPAQFNVDQIYPEIKVTLVR